jgi:hypothetical protein
MRDLWYRLFWNRDTQAARVSSAFRRGFMLGAMVALVLQSIAMRLF